MKKNINGKRLTIGAIVFSGMFAVLAPAQAIAGACDAEDAAAAQACKNEGSQECNDAADARSKCLRANASSSDSED